MSLNILFLGDIVGRPARNFIKESLPTLRSSHNLDLIIANAENAAGGAGINKSIAEELLKAGINAITLGDHTWDQRGFELEIDSLDSLCRPANLEGNCPGRDHLVLEIDGYRIGLFTLLGRTFMNKLKVSCPFKTADAILEMLAHKVDTTIVEIHAEATAEKVALGHYLDGRTAAVLGSHTHIPTADAHILPSGTAYITDLGMCGPYNSVLGIDKNIIIQKFLDSMPRRHEVATSDIRLSGAIIELCETTNKTLSIKHFEIKKDD